LGTGIWSLGICSLVFSSLGIWSLGIGNVPILMEIKDLALGLPSMSKYTGYYLSWPFQVSLVPFLALPWKLRVFYGIFLGAVCLF
jgi:hypothetical protein